MHRAVRITLRTICVPMVSPPPFIPLFPTTLGSQPPILAVESSQRSGFEGFKCVCLLLKNTLIDCGWTNGDVNDYFGTINVDPMSHVVGSMPRI